MGGAEAEVEKGKKVGGTEKISMKCCADSNATEQAKFKGIKNFWSIISIGQQIGNVRCLRFLIRLCGGAAGNTTSCSRLKSAAQRCVGQDE